MTESREVLGKSGEFVRALAEILCLGTNSPEV